jgi:hypothetical protein
MGVNPVEAIEDDGLGIANRVAEKLQILWKKSINLNTKQDKHDRKRQDKKDFFLQNSKIKRKKSYNVQ